MHDITLRKRAAAQLRESEQRYRLLFECNPQPMWVYDLETLRFLAVNAAAVFHYGYSVDEFLSLTIRDIRPPEDLPALAANLAHPAPSLEQSSPWRHRRKDGTVIEVEIASHELVFGGRRARLVLATDVTVRNQYARELRVAHDHQRQLLDHSPAVLYVLALEAGKIVPRMVSDNIGRLLGFGVRECLSHEWWLGQLHPDDREHAIASIAETLAQGTSSTEYRLRHKDGSYRWVDDHRRLVRAATGGTAELIGVWTDISERKAATDRIRESERRFRETLENLDLVALKLDTDGVVTFCNTALVRLTGLGREALLGSSWFDRFALDSAGSARRQYLDAIRSGKISPRHQHPIKSSAGELREIVWSNTAIRNATGDIVEVASIGEDVTERSRAEAALRASEQRFRTLFEQAAVGVAQTDAATGRFVQINQRFCAIVGRSREEMQQITFAAITDPRDVDRGVDMMKQLKAGTIREFSHEKRYLRKDGAEVWVSLTVSAMWAPGATPDYFIAIATDVTDRKRLEEQYRQAQKMESIGTLAGGIAHDFNNILAAIKGYTELAKMELDGGPVVEHLDAVLRGAARAAALVRQILAFSRRDADERIVVQLRPVVVEALALLRATVPANIEFETSLAADAAPVLADPSQIHQIIINLGANAAHAMRDGAGRLTVRLENFHVDAGLAAANPSLRIGACTRLLMKDTGRGMDAATLARIFEPFYTTKGPGEGTGLGLSVVHGIMQRHEGAVTVESRPGEGATFCLYFPPAAGEVAVETADLGEVPRGSGERILYVDDEWPLARLGQKILERLGYVVDARTSPAEALDAMRAKPDAFDLVVTDYMMPDLTGVELAQRIHEIRPGVPIVLVTGYTATLTDEHIQAMGIKKLVTKPISIESLGRLVHRLLNENKT